MGTSEVETIKEIQGRENIFVAYSQTTKLPYVTCGEESFNDQAWFFSEEEAIKFLCSSLGTGRRSSCIK